MPEAPDGDDGRTKKYMILLPDSVSPLTVGDSFVQTSGTAVFGRRFLLPPSNRPHEASRNSSGTRIDGGTVHLVFYSWLVDSICSDVVAPVENYSATGTVPTFYHGDDER